MIASISGIIESKGDDHLVISVSGIGFKVHMPSRSLNDIGRIGDDAYVHATLIVREDSLTLFGFQRELEKRTFEILLGVSGVGPRLALSMLNALTPDMIASAVQREDPGPLASVPGIGKKTAARIILELKGKLGIAVDFSEMAVPSSQDTDVLEMLTALGFSIAEAGAAIQSIPRDAPEDLEERVRLALMYFDR